VFFFSKKLWLTLQFFLMLTELTRFVLLCSLMTTSRRRDDVQVLKTTYIYHCHTMYRHNPYPASTTVLAKVIAVEEDAMGEPHSSGLSDCESRSMTPVEGMGRRNTSSFYDALSPSVPFFDYQTAGPTISRERAEHMGLVRLFVGQVPYRLEPGHVAWMLEMLSGRRVPLVEKIVRWTANQKPCGCFHVHVLPADVDALLQVDQTVLCEAEVLWVARTPAERIVLEEHCRYLKTNHSARTPLMPYQLMTVQPARSDYRPPQGRGRGAVASHW
jgi:hypothetical protein